VEIGFTASDLGARFYRVRSQVESEGPAVCQMGPEVQHSSDTILVAKPEPRDPISSGVDRVTRFVRGAPKRSREAPSACHPLRAQDVTDRVQRMDQSTLTRLAIDPRALQRSKIDEMRVCIQLGPLCTKRSLQLVVRRLFCKLPAERHPNIL
jgi:hypothetical protein